MTGEKAKMMEYLEPCLYHHHHCDLIIIIMADAVLVSYVLIESLRVC